MHRPAANGLSGALKLQVRSMHALALRYIFARHGRENLGFLWLFIEPMVLCIGVMVVWRIVKGNMDHGVTIVAMVFSGYMPLTLWRHMTNGTIFIYRQAKHILIHRQITYLDVILSHLILELITISAAALIIYLVTTELGLMAPAHDMSDVVRGWLVTAAVSVGFGLTIAAICEFNEVTVNFIQPLQYLMLPFSGCFFMLGWVPSKFREFLEYVPFVHGYEILRAGLFGPEIATYGNAGYALGWALVMSAIGLILLEKVRDRIA